MAPVQDRMGILGWQVYDTVALKWRFTDEGARGDRIDVVVDASEQLDLAALARDRSAHTRLIAITHVPTPQTRRDGLESFLSTNRPNGRIGVEDIWVSTRDQHSRSLVETGQPWFDSELPQLRNWLPGAVLRRHDTLPTLRPSRRLLGGETFTSRHAASSTSMSGTTNLITNATESARYAKTWARSHRCPAGWGGPHMDTRGRGEDGFRRRRLRALLGASLLAGVSFSITAAAQQLTTLYSLTGSGSGDGANPAASLIADPAGNLYGTTLNGGANGQGTVFQLDPSGNPTVLYSFTGGDGSHPRAALIAVLPAAILACSSSGTPARISARTNQVLRGKLFSLCEEVHIWWSIDDLICVVVHILAIVRFSHLADRAGDGRNTWLQYLHK
jgi:uncharacterized repeat protein (TIGR03803 family)